MAWNEQFCAHQKSYSKYMFQTNFEAFVHLSDCGCAPILQFFSVSSDGAKAERQIHNRMFSSTLTQFEEGWRLRL